MQATTPFNGGPTSSGRRRSRAAALTAFVVVGLLAGAVGVMGAAPASGELRPQAPVVFVHGFLLNVCPGGDVTPTFSTMVTMLKERGYSASTETVAYYACDDHGPSIQKSGQPGTYFESGQFATGGNTNDTDIRHISYQLAWYLYDTYSSRGQTVELVGHSMGGLIMRWALYQMQIGNPLFPPFLYVRDAITISTPHNGIDDGYDNRTWCPTSIQCSQMKPGSSFLEELRNHGMNPQATGGTAWTAMGSSYCDIMSADQSTDMGDVHKVIYTGSQSPGCYNHTSYLTDAGAGLDLPATYRNPGDTSSSSTTRGAHSLAWLIDALMGRHPASVGGSGGAPQTPQNDSLRPVTSALKGLPA